MHMSDIETTEATSRRSLPSTPRDFERALQKAEEARLAYQQVRRLDEAKDQARAAELAAYADLQEALEKHAPSSVISEV